MNVARARPEVARRQRMIVGVSGATGVVYAMRLLYALRTLDIETHLVVTKPGEMTLAYETDCSVRDLRGMADVAYAASDVGAAISSGSFRTLGMIVAPCSMRTVGEIASCASSNLLTRAADVCLKERRRLVLMVRETPLHAGHLRAMLAATEAGAVIFPPVPAFYARPATIADLVDHSVGRVLDLFDLDAGLVKRWKDDAPDQRDAPADDPAQPSSGANPHETLQRPAQLPRRTGSDR